jgi:hypothetical protein
MNAAMRRVVSHAALSDYRHCKKIGDCRGTEMRPEEKGSRQRSTPPFDWRDKNYVRLLRRAFLVAARVTVATS